MQFVFWDLGPAKDLGQIYDSVLDTALCGTKQDSRLFLQYDRTFTRIKNVGDLLFEESWDADVGNTLNLIYE